MSSSSSSSSSSFLIIMMRFSDFFFLGQYQTVEKISKTKSKDTGQNQFSRSGVWGFHLIVGRRLVTTTFIITGLEKMAFFRPHLLFFVDRLTTIRFENVHWFGFGPSAKASFAAARSQWPGLCLIFILINY